MCGQVGLWLMLCFIAGRAMGYYHNLEIMDQITIHEHGVCVCGEFSVLLM